MYESIDVWRRSRDGSLRRYRCFRALGSGQYCVQSMDVLRPPIDEGRLRELQIQFHELLAEVDPVERSGGFPTLQEAIADHDAAFGTNE
jgi:hypothetical protein